jgi:hypothetical protein
VDPLSIDILCTPQQFKTELFKQIKSAQRKIILCSLYLGTAEDELVISNLKGPRNRECATAE